MRRFRNGELQRGQEGSVMICCHEGGFVGIVGGKNGSGLER